MNNETTERAEPVAWMRPAGMGPEFTDDALLAGYWMRKGSTVTALYATPPTADSAADARDAARLDWLEAHCTGASDSERYLPFRVYWGNKGATQGIRAQLDKAMNVEGSAK